MWQLGLTPFSDTDSAIATPIIDAVNNTGYLSVPVEEILESMGNETLIMAEVEAVLKRVYHFDPIGVASRDLCDFLLVQLSQYAKGTPYLAEGPVDHQRIY